MSGTGGYWPGEVGTPDEPGTGGCEPGEVRPKPRTDGSGRGGVGAEYEPIVGGWGRGEVGAPDWPGTGGEMGEPGSDSGRNGSKLDSGDSILAGSNGASKVGETNFGGETWTGVAGRAFLGGPSNCNSGTGVE